MKFSQLKLVSRAPQSGIPTVYTSSADIDYDKDGNFVLCNSTEGLEQVLLKGAFTSAQSDGYGTMLPTLVGTKSKRLITTLIMSELVKCYNLIKKYQVDFLIANPGMDKKQIIGKLLSVQVAKSTPTAIQVRLKTESLYESSKANSSNQTLNFTL